MHGMRMKRNKKSKNVTYIKTVMKVFKQVDITIKDGSDVDIIENKQTLLIFTIIGLTLTAKIYRCIVCIAHTYRLIRSI